MKKAATVRGSGAKAQGRAAQEIVLVVPVLVVDRQPQKRVQGLGFRAKKIFNLNKECRV